jgi:(2Fe-2S) ferredoxin
MFLFVPMIVAEKENRVQTITASLLKLKDAVNAKGWKGKVRISTSGCMGLCAKGSNVIIYPQKIWFSEVFPDDVDEIVSTIERVMADD